MTDRINGAQIAKIIDNYDNSQYVTNDAYYQGSNPTILAKDFDGTPDNRVPLPFGRRTVLDIMGYAYKPGYVKYDFNVEGNNEKGIQKIEEIFEHNQENLVSAEVFQDALIKGQGAELMYWVDGDSLPEFVQVPREQCIFVYEDTIKEQLKYSIRYYTSIVVNQNGDVEKIKHADVYYKDIIQYFEQKEIQATQTVDPQLTTQRNTTDEYNSYIFQGEERHFFDDIPLYPMDISTDRLGVFQPSIKIIDAMDDMTSDSILNALQRFNDSILTLSKKLTDDVIDNIKEYRIMDNMGGKEEGNFVEFVQRKLDINSTIDGFQIYERLYYELTGIPNLSDEKFHSQSGIAILYALIPFENLISTMEVYFNNGLQYRLQLLNNLLKTDIKASISWKRNLPEDILGKINELILLKREGLISLETALEKLPDAIVSDPESEIDKIKTEKEENMSMFENQFEEPMDDEDDKNIIKDAKEKQDEGQQ